MSPTRVQQEAEFLLVRLRHLYQFGPRGFSPKFLTGLYCLSPIDEITCCNIVDWGLNKAGSLDCGFKQIKISGGLSLFRFAGFEGLASIAC